MSNFGINCSCQAVQYVVQVVQQHHFTAQLVGQWQHTFIVCYLHVPQDCGLFVFSCRLQSLETSRLGVGLKKLSYLFTSFKLLQDCLVQDFWDLFHAIQLGGGGLSPYRYFPLFCQGLPYGSQLHCLPVNMQIQWDINTTVLFYEFFKYLKFFIKSNPWVLRLY